MLKLSKLGIPGAATLRYLTKRQNDIDGKPANQQVSRAQTLWDAKGGSKDGTVAFAEVKQLLADVCVGTKLCNYCEQGEATDVEHIYPKSFFPKRTFQWPNYLLACSTCNSHYKGDKFAVFPPTQPTVAVELKRGQPVPCDDAAFIDPRLENPMKYLWLDLLEGTYQLRVHHDLIDPRDIAKAEHTLRILQIGERRSLADPRGAAFQFFQAQLERYEQIGKATTWGALEKLARDPHLVDRTNPLNAERQRMMDGLKAYILGYPHPTVWHEMKRQRQWLPKTGQLFAAVPEALLW